MGAIDQPVAPGHWDTVARAWGHVGPPLRPSDQDLAFVTEAGRASVASGGLRRVVVLGVTTELATSAWPDDTQVFGVDHTRAMVESVWPRERGTAVLGDWTALPIASGSVDLVAGDGGFHLLDLPGQARVAAELARVVRPGGHAALRLFVPPTRAETPATVLADLRAGLVRDLNELKLRLWMAMQVDAAAGVGLDDVWRAVADMAGSDPDAFASAIGWDPEHLAALASYRGSSERYHLVDVDSAVSTLTRDGRLEVADVCVPSYARGGQCPTVILRRTGGDR